MAKANTSKSVPHVKSTVGPGQDAENGGMKSPPERPVRQRHRSPIRPSAAGAPPSTGGPAVNESYGPPHAKSEMARTEASNDNAPEPDTSGEAPDYAVGYGRPPKHARFKKGQSGNPAGRSPGSKNLRTIYQQERDARIEISEMGRRRKASKMEVLMKKTFNDALNGNPRARDALLKLETSHGTDLPLHPFSGASGALAVDSDSQDERDRELLAEFRRIVIEETLAEALASPGADAEGPSACADQPADTSGNSEDCFGEPDTAAQHGDDPKPSSGQPAQGSSGEDDDRPVHRPLRTFRDGEWIQR